MGDFECDGESGRYYQDKYVGFSGETGRRLLCTPGYAYGECEGTGACQYNRIGCRLYLYGICARTDQGYQEPAEDASDGDSVYQEAGCPSV